MTLETVPIKCKTRRNEKAEIITSVNRCGPSARADGLFHWESEPSGREMAVKVSRKALKRAKGRKVRQAKSQRAVRLREGMGSANGCAPFKMIAAIKVARKIVVFVFLVWSGLASATTYYVSSTAGSDANSGTAVSTPWQTIAHVNGQTFSPGDSILFKRGDVWNESLATASSGSSGNPITFDAYGTGAAPNLTGYYSVPSSAWVHVTGNAWKAPVPATYTAINFCLFGSVWGEKVAAVSSNLTAWGDFYLASGFVYVFSPENPASYYVGAIVPMGLSNVPVINVNGQSWLTFQHLLVNWFDQYGVYVQGASDHLVFANMEADSMIPQGTQPLGFYVDENAPGPGDIKIYNSEGLFGDKRGAEKKEGVVSCLESAVDMTDAVAAREIIEPDKFRDGISKIIDGTVECLNASTWCKRPSATSSQPSA